MFLTLAECYYDIFSNHNVHYTVSGCYNDQLRKAIVTMTSNSSLYLYYLRVRISRNAFTAESQSQRQFGRGVERLRAEIQRKETHQHADRRELQAPEDEGGDRSDDGNGRNRKDRAEGEIDIPGDDVVLGADQSVLRCVCVWVSEEAWSEG